MSQNSTDLGDGTFATGIPYQPAEQQPTPYTPDPSTTSMAYREMKAGWDMVDAIWGGTRTMMNSQFLIQDEGESSDSYALRLARSVFFNATKRTIQMLVGKPFSKPVTWDKTMDPEMKKWMDDVDRAGMCADLLLKDTLRNQIKDGHAIYLIDYDAVGDPTTLNQKEAEDLGLRPYVTLVDARDVLFWRSDVVNGKQILVHIRIREVTTEPDGEWGEKTVKRIRVFDRGVFDPLETGALQLCVRWTLYREDDTNKDKPVWIREASGFLQAVGNKYLIEIPIVAAYGMRKGYFESELPLEDLMWLNIDHWRSASDQRNILHHARVPKLFAKGFIPGAKTGETTVGKVTLGPDRLIATDNPQGDLKYVETEGNAIDAGRQNCEDIKMEMAVMGAEKLVKKTVFSTATESMHDNTAEDSELGAMCKSLEDAWADVLRFMAIYAGKDEATAGSIEINKDFGIFPWQLQILASLIQLYTLGAITQETLLTEFQRLGALSDVLVIEDEVKSALAEIPQRAKVLQQLGQGTKPQPKPAGAAGDGSNVA
jgi:hypothetical protein